MKLPFFSAAMIVLLAGAGCTRPINNLKTPMPTVKPTAVPGCLAEWKATRRLDSYFTDPVKPVKIEKIRAAAVPADATPIGEKLDNGRQAFWLLKNGREIIVDRNEFSDLLKVRPFSLNSQQAVTIGTMPKPTPYGRSVLQLLVNVGVIETFVHTEAVLCLNSETNKDGNYRATVKAVQTYYTYERVDEAYDFAFTIDTGTGNLTIERLDGPT